MIWVGLWDLGLGFRVYVFSLIGFIRTLYIIFSKASEGQPSDCCFAIFCVWVEALWKTCGSSCSFL